MKNTSHQMTLPEIAIAATVTALIFAALLPLTMFTVRSVDEARTAAYLEQQMLLAKERIKKDLATTSRSMVVMYPTPDEGARGVSMPVLQRPDDVSSLPLDSTGGIAWNRTVVYHVFDNPATGKQELRRTFFDPRDNSLTPEQRLDQLEATVFSGDGSHELYGESHGATRVLAEHLSSYIIDAGLANVDTYDSAAGRNLYQLGTWVLQPGTNDFLFKIVGKNFQSSGYDVNLDLLAVSSTGTALEAESLYPPILSGGGVAKTQTMADRAFWSNNRGLYFDATGADDFMTLSVYNDLWLDSTFVEGEATTNQSEVLFDPILGENVLRMAGDRTSWEARVQAQDEVPESSSAEYAGGTARVIISNVDEVTGGNLGYSGNAGRIRFRAMSGQTVDITEAWIMERTTGFSGDSTTKHRLTFKDAAAAETSGVYNDGDSIAFSGMTVESDLVSLPLSTEKDYLVSFRFGDNTTSTSVPEWKHPSGVIQTGFVVGDDIGAAGTADWCSLAGKTIAELDHIPSLDSIYVTYPVKATYTSAILDTKLSAPPYETVNWEGAMPVGTEIRLKIRSGSAADLSGAPDWSSLPEITRAELPKSISGLAGRYVQWQAILLSEPPCLETPSLQEVAVRWLGEKRGCDVALIADRGPDKGIFELYVNGQGPSPASLRLDFTFSAERRGKTFQRSFTISSFPQNTF